MDNFYYPQLDIWFMAFAGVYLMCIGIAWLLFRHDIRFDEIAELIVGIGAIAFFTVAFIWAVLFYPWNF